MEKNFKSYERKMLEENTSSLKISQINGSLLDQIDSSRIKQIYDRAAEINNSFYFTERYIFDTLDELKQAIANKYLAVWILHEYTVAETEAEEHPSYGFTIHKVVKSERKKKFFIQYVELSKKNWDLLHAGFFKRLFLKLKG